MVAETAPADMSSSSISGSSTEGLFVPETCTPNAEQRESSESITDKPSQVEGRDAVAKKHETPRECHIYDRRESVTGSSLDETIGIDTSQYEDRESLPKQAVSNSMLCSMVPGKQEPVRILEENPKPVVQRRTSDELLRLESDMLSPVSNFLDDVLSSVKGKSLVHNDDSGKRKLHHYKQRDTVNKADMPPPPPKPTLPKMSAKDPGSSLLDYSKSPSIFSEEECPEENRPVEIDEDVTALSQVDSPADIFVTKMKKV